MDQEQFLIPQEQVHLDHYIVYTKTQSPDGKPCIGMLYQGKVYLLFTVKRAAIAARNILDLQREGIDAIPGMSLNWLHMMDTGGKLSQYDTSDLDMLQTVGIYVHVDQYDSVRRVFTR